MKRKKSWKRRKKKGITLKADIEEESDKDNEKVESDLSDLEVAFLAKKFRNFTRKKRNFPRKNNTNKKETSKEIEKKMPMCFECNKLGHLRAECPQPSKEHKRKKKALMVAWGDSEDSSLDDEQKESANICFMAREDEVHSTSHSNLDVDIDELFDSYNELMDEYKKLNKKKRD